MRSWPWSATQLPNIGHLRQLTCQAASIVMLLLHPSMHLFATYAQFPSSTLPSLIASSFRPHSSRPRSSTSTPDNGLPSCAPITSPNTCCQHQPLFCRLRGAESSRLSECVCAEGVFKRRQPALANTTVHPTASATSPVARDQEALPLHNCSEGRTPCRSRPLLQLLLRRTVNLQATEGSTTARIQFCIPVHHPTYSCFNHVQLFDRIFHALTGMCLLSSFLSRHLHILGAMPRSSCVGWFHPAVNISGDSTMQS
jgi:hypothetical protein